MDTRHIEELTLNAWPALQTVLYDGWILRFANGYTRRANSVNPLLFSTLDVEEKIASCEQLYRRRGLNVVFKMTPSNCPENLDDILARRGYQQDALTSLQTLALGDLDGSAGACTLTETPSADWLDASCRLSETDGQRAATLRQILGNLVPRAGFASLCHDGRVIACGLSVVQDGFVGLFDIVTDAGFRNRGFGQQLVHELLAWAKAQGAHTAYLQVMLNNPPALRLYAKLGFQEIYQYWYRVCTG
ncbi:MAG: GNAT family N-acetyltransferase [Thermoflexales bacterium]|nr:GNAT family N-acetyltransferase [Thermoflexales bacterium]